MANAGRALLKLSSSTRRFLSFKLDATDGVNISPARGVPGILHEAGEQYTVEVPDVSAIHMSVHGSGRVHIRANQGGTIYDSASFPPLRDLAAPTYVLEIHPAALDSYPILDRVRPGDVEIDISSVEQKGFAAAIAVAGPRADGEPHRASYPGLQKTRDDVDLRHSRHAIGKLEFQVAILSPQTAIKPYQEHDEFWRLIHPAEPGDALPRPWGGTISPPPWQPSREEAKDPTDK